VAGSACEVFREVYFRLYNEQNNTRYGKTRMPRYDGGTAVDGRKYKPVWPSVAQKLLDHGLDVESYLQDTLSRYTIRSPQEAVKSEYIERYKRELQNDASVKDAWDAEEKTLLSEVEIRRHLGEDPVMSLVNAVCDPGISVSPLVRYCFAALNGKAHFVKDLRQDAYEQYCQKRHAYDRFCGGRIPPEWRSHGNY